MPQIWSKNTLEEEHFSLFTTLASKCKLYYGTRHCSNHV